jgi:hypothetical protein
MPRVSVKKFYLPKDPKSRILSLLNEKLNKNTHLSSFLKDDNCLLSKFLQESKVDELILIIENLGRERVSQLLFKFKEAEEIANKLLLKENEEQEENQDSAVSAFSGYLSRKYKFSPHQIFEEQLRGHEMRRIKNILFSQNSNSQNNSSNNLSNKQRQIDLQLIPSCQENFASNFRSSINERFCDPLLESQFYIEGLSAFLSRKDFVSNSLLEKICFCGCGLNQEFLNLFSSSSSSSSKSVRVRAKFLSQRNKFSSSRFQQQELFADNEFDLKEVRDTQQPKKKDDEENMDWIDCDSSDEDDYDSDENSEEDDDNDDVDDDRNLQDHHHRSNKFQSKQIPPQLQRLLSSSSTSKKDDTDEEDHDKTFHLEYFQIKRFQLVDFVLGIIFPLKMIGDDLDPLISI